MERKKVLIITYHWPPSGGITVLRCLKFAKYLRNFGWEPIIFTAKNASYQVVDYHNEKDIPENIELHQVPIFEPINAFKKISGRKKNEALQNITSNSTKKRTLIDKLGMWVRGNFFIPDARYRWIKPSIKYLSLYLEKNPVDAILTDGPPHTNTVIGLELSKKFGIPWLADFQDPWTQVDYYEKLYIGKRADKKHKLLEQEVFQNAQKITIASPTWKKDLESIGAKNVDVIFYGYDEEDFKTYRPIASDKFIIFHGGLLGNDRNPSQLFKALQALIQENPSLRSLIQIELAGEVDIAVIESIKKYNLESNLTLLGMISRKEVMQKYAQSSLLLLPINQAKNAQGRVPGKLFEMLRSQKPILVFGPNNGDVKQIVESKTRGISYEYEDFHGIYQFLKLALDQKQFINFSPEENVDEFSNEQITGKIARYLDEISKR